MPAPQPTSDWLSVPGLLPRALYGSNGLILGCRRQVLRGVENRLDVGRNSFHPFKSSFKHRPQDAKRIEHLLGLGIVAFGLYGEKLAVEVPDGRLDFRHVDGKGPVAVLQKGAVIEQVVELYRHSFAVCVVESEAQAAKGRSKIG